MKGLFVHITLLLFSFAGIGQIEKNDSLKSGYVRLYYPGGALSSEGILEDGKPEGYWKTYYKKGNLKSEGSRENFLLNGTWKFYREDGTISQEIRYFENERNGLTNEYDAEENIFLSTPYQKGVKEGIQERYFPTGELREEIPYKEGKKEGTGYIYAGEDGRVVNIKKYSNGNLMLDDRINRKDEFGKRIGKWVEFHPNRIKKLVGTYENDLKHGIFKEYDEEGKLIGLYKYENGKLKEEGGELDVLKTEYKYFPSGKKKRKISTSLPGKRQGYTWVYDEEGNIISQKFFQQDTILWEGVMDKEGKRQGYWIFYYPSGEKRAEGEYEDDKEVGPWKYYYENGKLEQHGDFRKGIAYGKWEWLFENGKKRRSEEYRKGKLDGEVIEYDKYGYILKEEKYVDGVKEGKAYYGAGDHVEVGKYRDGMKHGEWKYYKHEVDEENLYFSGYFKEGQPHGQHIYYDENRKIERVIQYNYGEKDGESITYLPQGGQEKKVYKKGELVAINGFQLDIKEREERKGKKNIP